LAVVIGLPPEQHRQTQKKKQHQNKKTDSNIIREVNLRCPLKVGVRELSSVVPVMVVPAAWLVKEMFFSFFLDSLAEGIRWTVLVNVVGRIRWTVLVNVGWSVPRVSELQIFCCPIRIL
jgi:hypothetical protein